MTLVWLQLGFLPYGVGSCVGNLGRALAKSGHIAEVGSCGLKQHASKLAAPTQLRSCVLAYSFDNHGMRCHSNFIVGVVDAF